MKFGCHSNTWADEVPIVKATNVIAIVCQTRSMNRSYWSPRLLLVEKSDSARIETVVAANYLNLAGINFSLKNRRR